MATYMFLFNMTTAQWLIIYNFVISETSCGSQPLHCFLVPLASAHSSCVSKSWPQQQCEYIFGSSGLSHKIFFLSQSCHSAEKTGEIVKKVLPVISDRENTRNVNLLEEKTGKTVNLKV